jgi:hypothetical protein
MAVIQFISHCHYLILYLNISSLEKMKENIQVNVQGTYYDLILCPCHNITPVVPKLRYPELEQESVNTVCFSKYHDGGLKNFTSPIVSDMELVEISYAVGVCVCVCVCARAPARV